VAGSLLFGFLALSKDWPTPGAYLIEWLFHPGAVPDVKTDLRIVWAVDVGVFVATNFLCCLAIFYVLYLMLRKRLSVLRQSSKKTGQKGGSNDRS
jgi:hypothetical protein